MTMKTMTVSEVLIACGGEFCGDEEVLQKNITSIVTDSRKVENGSLFAAIAGARADGHDFVNSCLDNGAVCAICEKKIENPHGGYILVKSTVNALGRIAAYYRSLFSIPVIGVSGSVGKTSTKEMLSDVLSQKFKVHKTPGNYNNALGVPLTLFGLEEDDEVAVVEMGISDFGEMRSLSEIVCPNICVLTNIGNCHLEKLINRDGVLKAKTEMFENMAENAAVYLNGDDDKLSSIENIGSVVPVFFGIGSKNSYYAENISGCGFDGIKCTLCTPKQRIDVKIPAIGNYMISNALAAVAVAEQLGLDALQIKKGIESYRTISGRANVICTEKYIVLDDCYNANPASMKAGIDSLANCKGRRVCILGDMKELGGAEVEMHREIGAYLNGKDIDVLIAVGTLAKEIYSVSKLENKYWFESVEKAITALPDILCTGDSILAKASNSMRFKEIVEALKR